MSKENSLPLADFSTYGFLYSMFEEIYDNNKEIEELEMTKNIMTIEEQKQIPLSIESFKDHNVYVETQLKTFLKKHMDCYYG